MSEAGGITPDSMVDSFEAYYADSYGAEARGIMVAYLAKVDAADHDLLRHLYAQTLYTFPRRFKTAPGIAELQAVRPKAREAMIAERASKRARLPAPDPASDPDLMPPEAVRALIAQVTEGKKLDNGGQV